MKPYAILLAACLALAIPATAGCGGPLAKQGQAALGEAKTPGAATNLGTRPSAGANAEEPARAEPPAPKPETPARPPAEPPRPVVNLETPALLLKTPALPATYTWGAADRLYLVARRFYGDGRLWPKIVEANRHIQSLVEIPPGTVITIPAK
jgi:nucleoid-associated protein YgaU